MNWKTSYCRYYHCLRCCYFRGGGDGAFASCVFLVGAVAYCHKIQTEAAFQLLLLLLLLLHHNKDTMGMAVVLYWPVGIVLLRQR